MRCRETNPMADIYRCLASTHTPRQFARLPFVHANSVKRGVGRFASPSSLVNPQRRIITHFWNNVKTVSASVKYYCHMWIIAQEISQYQCAIFDLSLMSTGPRFNKSAHKITKNSIHLKKNTFLQLNISSNKNNIK